MPEDIAGRLYPFRFARRRWRAAGKWLSGLIKQGVCQVSGWVPWRVRCAYPPYASHLPFVGRVSATHPPVTREETARTLPRSAPFPCIKCPLAVQLLLWGYRPEPGDGKHRLGNLHHPFILIHRELAQLMPRLLLAELLMTHQQAFGAIDKLTFFKVRL